MSEIKNLIDDLQKGVSQNKLQRLVEEMQLQIKAERLAGKSPKEWAEVENDDFAAATEHRKEAVKLLQWDRSDERWTMVIAADLAPTMPDAPTDDIAKRAAWIVSSVRARFEGGEG